MASRAPRRRRARPLRWLAIAGLVVVGFLYYKPVRTWLGTRHELAGRQAEVNRLRAQHQRLERRLARTKTPDALLQEARRLGFVKPGERLYIVKGIEAWRREHAAAR